MNWIIAIDRNRNALLSIIFLLMKSLGLVDGGKLTTLPSRLYRKVLFILRPAEAAVRRLIMMAAYEMELRGVKLRTSRPVVGRSAFAFSNTTNFAPSFNLIDPLKSGRGEQPDFALFGPAFADHHGAPDQIRIPAIGLGCRILALKNALDTIEKQALRLIRWYGLRDEALRQSKPHRFSPLRPGLPPHLRKRPRNEIETILSECHSLALHARERRESS